MRIKQVHLLAPLVVACSAIFALGNPAEATAPAVTIDLDTSFGTGGKVLTVEVSSTDAILEAIKVQSDGKIVAVGTGYGDTSYDFVVARYNTDGSLDTTFDGDGIVATDIGGDVFDTAQGVALQSDGKIVVVGGSDANGTRDFTIVRYNTDGSLDTTFDTDGIVTTDFAGGVNDTAIDVVIRSDGKIVVCGFADPTSIDFAVARYNSDGSLDTTFDTDGKVTTDIWTNRIDAAESLSLQTDGKIVVAGYTQAFGSNDFEVIRYNSDGSLDTTFDTDGMVTTDIGTGSDDSAMASAIQPDGKLLAAGYSTARGSKDFTLVRYNADGSLDTTFDTDGVAITENGAGTEDSATAMAMRSGGKILAAGFSSASGSKDFTMMQYNADGSLDTTFDTDGKVSTDVGTASDDDARTLAVLPSGKFVIGGSSNAGGSRRFSLVRYVAMSSAPTSTTTPSSSRTDQLTETGFDSSEVAIIATLLIGTGVVLTSRRRTAS